MFMVKVERSQGHDSRADSDCTSISVVYKTVKLWTRGELGITKNNSGKHLDVGMRFGHVYVA